MKACAICGAPALNGKTRCAVHYVPPHSHSRQYQQTARAIVATATKCHICGQPPTKDDPLTADHLVPHSLGGSNHPTNLRAAHRSCNSRRGTALVA